MNHSIILLMFNTFTFVNLRIAKKELDETNRILLFIHESGIYYLFTKQNSPFANC